MLGCVVACCFDLLFVMCLWFVVNSVVSFCSLSCGFEFVYLLVYYG